MFKASNKNINFPTQFCLGNIFNKSDAIDSKYVSLKENVFDISVDYNSIHESDILNIYRYLMIKNNI